MVVEESGELSEQPYGSILSQAAKAEGATTIGGIRVGVK